jgi:hypothetical protein
MFNSIGKEAMERASFVDDIHRIIKKYDLSLGVIFDKNMLKTPVNIMEYALLGLIRERIILLSIQDKYRRNQKPLSEKEWVYETDLTRIKNSS